LLKHCNQVPSEDHSYSHIGLGLYELGCRANHSCRPNALWQVPDSSPPAPYSPVSSRLDSIQAFKMHTFSTPHRRRMCCPEAHGHPHRQTSAHKPLLQQGEHISRASSPSLLKPQIRFFAGCPAEWPGGWRKGRDENVSEPEEDKGRGGSDKRLFERALSAETGREETAEALGNKVVCVRVREVRLTDSTPCDSHGGAYGRIFMCCHALLIIFQIRNPGFGFRGIRWGLDSRACS
jgi:hypothetical protein